MLPISLIAIVVILGLIFKYSYWWSRKVKTVYYPFPFLGNISGHLISKQHYSEFMSKWYFEFKKDKFVGFFIFLKPYLLITDPNLSKVIFSENFENFSDRGYPDVSKIDPLGFNLITSQGSEWKNQRESIQPIMNLAKLKTVIPLWERISSKLIDSIKDENLEKGCVDIEKRIIENLTELFTTTCLGITYESYLENPILKEIVDEIAYPTRMQNLRTLFTQICPGVLRALKWSRLSRSKVDYLKEFYEKLIHLKRSSESTTQKNLFMALVEAHETEKIKENFQDSKTLLVANAQVLFSAGLDSAHTALSLLVYELAKNPDIQEKLYSEVSSVMETRTEFTYQSILDMEYLEAVVKETLRMYPPFPFTLRRCRKPFKVPNSGGVTLHEGDVVIIPIYSYHHDPNNFPQPHVFDPDRFYKRCKDDYKHVYIPFGKGQRNCVAYNFARLQMRLLVALLVLNFKFELGEKSPKYPKFKHYVFSRKLDVQLMVYPKVRT